MGNQIPPMIIDYVFYFTSGLMFADKAIKTLASLGAVMLVHQNYINLNQITDTQVITGIINFYSKHKCQGILMVICPWFAFPNDHPKHY